MGIEWSRDRPEKHDIGLIKPCAQHSTRRYIRSPQFSLTVLIVPPLHYPIALFSPINTE